MPSGVDKRHLTTTESQKHLQSTRSKYDDELDTPSKLGAESQARLQNTTGGEQGEDGLKALKLFK